jgi:hypothetical protein
LGAPTPTGSIALESPGPRWLRGERELGGIVDMPVGGFDERGPVAPARAMGITEGCAE